MDGINSIVNFPITYIADGECKSLDTFPVKKRNKWIANNGILQLTQILTLMVQILLKVMLSVVVPG